MTALLWACTLSASVYAGAPFYVVKADTLVHLNEVTVTAKRIEHAGDRYVIHVPTNENKNMDEVLRQAPGIWMDNRSILINGTGGTKVFVNDREIRLEGEQLVAYLRSIPAQNIKRVEVQSMADAGRSADLQGGIICLYLRKKTIDGLSASLSLDERIGSRMHTWQPTAFLDVRKGKWNVYASGAYTLRPTDKGRASSVRHYRSDNIAMQSSERVGSPYRHYRLSVGGLLDIDSTQQIGLETEWAGSSLRQNSEALTLLSIAGVARNSRGDYRQQSQYDAGSIATNYKKTLDARGSELKVMGDYIHKSSSSNNFYSILSLWNNVDTAYSKHTSADYDIASADVSVHHRLPHAQQLLWGGRYAFTRMNNKAADCDLLYHEHIGAIYAEYSFHAGRWNGSAGLRLEHTATRNRTDGIHRNSTDLYPHVSVTYAFDEMKQWMLNLQYAEKVERPNFLYMNPTRIQTSEYAYMVGNPRLRPTYIYKFYLTLIAAYRYTLTIGCNSNKDIVRPYSRQDALNPLSNYVTYENHRGENDWFVALSAPIDMGRSLRLTVNMVGVRQYIRKNGDEKYDAHNLVFANATLAARMGKGFNAELEYSLHNRMYTSNSQIGTSQNVGFTVRKLLLNGRMTVVAGVENLFNRYERYRVVLPHYTTDTEMRMPSDGRKIRIGLSWRIDKGKKAEKRKVESSAAEERNRMEQETKKY